MDGHYVIFVQYNESVIVQGSIGFIMMREILDAAPSYELLITDPKDSFGFILVISLPGVLQLHLELLVF